MILRTPTMATLVMRFGVAIGGDWYFVDWWSASVLLMKELRTRATALYICNLCYYYALSQKIVHKDLDISLRLILWMKIVYR